MKTKVGALGNDTLLHPAVSIPYVHIIALVLLLFWFWWQKNCTNNFNQVIWWRSHYEKLFSMLWLQSLFDNAQGFFIFFVPRFLLVSSHCALFAIRTTRMKAGGIVTVPTIMWLQTSQNVGFLKMCSMKQCPAESTCSGLRDWERDVGGGAEGMAGGTGGMGRWVVCGGAIPMLQRWPVLLLTSESSSVLLSLLVRKKLSALLLRMVLVLKDKERLSLCSWILEGKKVEVKWSKGEKLIVERRENERGQRNSVAWISSSNNLNILQTQSLKPSGKCLSVRWPIKLHWEGQLITAQWKAFRVPHLEGNVISRWEQCVRSLSHTLCRHSWLQPLSISLGSSFAVMLFITLQTDNPHLTSQCVLPPP